MEVSRYTRDGVAAELQAVALLEMAVSCVFRRQEEAAISYVSKARGKCGNMSADNSTILQGRCEYILSRLFRYLKQYEKAREHVIKAKQILFNAEPGEDSAFANYCDACISVESLSEDSTLEEFQAVERCFRFAIEYDHSHNSGLKLVAPHSFMRLAQMYLGSGHYVAGSVKNQERICCATNCLESVHVECLSLDLRSACHFHLIQSDLYWNKGMLAESQLSATQALDVSRRQNFTNEIQSAENRLRALGAL